MQKRVAVVTGASRGVGKGVAQELCQAGFMVYITGRSVADMSYIQGKGTAILCDHSNDQQVERTFAQISQEQGRIDVLVNNAWGGYENMMENGEFTWSRPFWQQPRWRWDSTVAHRVLEELPQRSLVRQDVAHPPDRRDRFAHSGFDVPGASSAALDGAHSVLVTRSGSSDSSAC